MCRVAVVLLYRPGGADAHGEFRVAASSDIGAVRAVGEAVLREAEESVEFWAEVDPDFAAMRQTEVDRLRRILALLLPDERDPYRGGGLRLVPPRKPRGSREQDR